MLISLWVLRYYHHCEYYHDIIIVSTRMLLSWSWLRLCWPWNVLTVTVVAATRKAAATGTRRRRTRWSSTGKLTCLSQSPARDIIVFWYKAFCGIERRNGVLVCLLDNLDGNHFLVLKILCRHPCTFLSAPASQSSQFVGISCSCKCVAAISLSFSSHTRTVRGSIRPTRCSLLFPVSNPPPVNKTQIVVDTLVYSPATVG